MTTEIITTYKSIDEYSPEQIRAYKRALKCENCSNDEWELLKITSSAYKLNPFLKEIWLLPGIGVMVGHAGLIQMAMRSANYNGIKTMSYDFDGKPYTGKPGQKLAYSTAVVSLITGGTVEKTVLFSEVNRGGSGRSGWDKMPRIMLEKVAESHALRRAFGFSGCYIPEEYGEEDISQNPKVIIDITPESEISEPASKPIQQSAPDVCPICGGKSAEPIQRSPIQASYDRDHLGEIPAGLCIDCINHDWREKKGIPHPVKKVT